MAEVTVKQLAEVVGTPVEKLLVQLKEAGLEKAGPDALISNDEKMQLLDSLRKAHGTAENAAKGESKITLRRKKVSEIKVGSGSKKTVNVEVRGKRTYVKRNAALLQAEEERQRALSEAKEKAEREAHEQEQKRLAAEEAKRLEEETKVRQREEEQRRQEEQEAARLVQEQEEQRLRAEQAERERREAQEAKLRAEDEARQQEAQRRQEEDAQRSQQSITQSADSELPSKDNEVSASQRDLEVRGSHKEDTMHAKAEPKRNSSRPASAGAASSRPASSGAASSAHSKGRDSSKNKRGKSGASSAPGGNNANSRGNNANTRGKSGRNAGGKRGAQGGNHGRRRGHQSHQMETKHGFAKPSAPVIHEVSIPETITVAELANKMAVKAAEVIKSMMKMGVMATINQVLDQDTAVLVVEEMGHKPVMQSANDVEIELTKKIAGDDEGDMQSRPPVVTVMGHVDHGKTSLLDHIRRTRIAAGEAGGITQHIGAYHVETDQGVVTFLDTPGHAAFTAMRARGAQSTDIVVLVVAADDGVMPQTVEAIQHAKAAEVPLVVAVNKMDKPEADFDRVTNELSQYNVMPEDWGGEHIFVKVSAHTGTGIDELLESILLQAEVLELKAPAKGNAQGTVIEASLDKGRGPVATVLVQRGELEKGQIVVCGSEFGRVRAMFDEAGQAVSVAGPSIPVQILGLSAVPDAGDEMLVAKDERDARELANFRQQRERDARLAERKPAKLDDVFSQIRSGDTATLNLLIKADVQGSFEALRDSLERLSNDEISIRIIGGGVGGINESDATLAAASNAILIGFNVRADNAARRVIQEQEVDLNYYSVIYDVIDLVKAAGSGMLAPEVVERIIGVAEVKDVFRSPKFGAVAGSIVIEGTVRRYEPIRVLRDNVVIYEGELESLRRYKDDVNEVRMGTECGIAVKNYNDVRAGDKIEVYERKEVARTL